MSIVNQLLNFYDAPAAASFTLPPAEAIAYFKAKGLKITFDWRDMIGAEHAGAFTVAKMADLDMLADIQASLDDAIAQGLSYESWSDTITPLLQQKGWWGRKAVTDPLTGETIVAQLGSPGRLKTIFRTNVQSAYAAGHWQQIQANKDVAEYLLYDAVDDTRTRPQHAEWDGTVLPVDSSWWKTHYPPNGWNCRCGVIQLSADDLEDLGLSVNTQPPGGGSSDWKNPRTGKTEKIEKGLDPGWNSNPGATHLAMLQKLAAEKIKAMMPKPAIAAAQGMKAAEAQAIAVAEQAGLTIAPTIADPAVLAKGAGKAKTRAAEVAIAKALKANTPYLAKAIQKLQKSKATDGMDPVELLAKAQAEATKVKESAALANWKQAQLAGKPGAPAGKAVFDALPEPAQASILADIEAQTGAKAATKAIDDQLAAIAKGDNGILQQKQLEWAKANMPELTGEKLLAYMNAQPAKLTPGQQAGGLAGWKKNAIAGKPPTDKQQLAFDSLNDTQKANALQQVDDAKAATNVEAVKAKIASTWDNAIAKGTAEAKSDIPPGPTLVSTAVPDINPSRMRQIGPQKGSNEGGTYVDDVTGTEWYIKFPVSSDMARNEVLAAKLYEAVGIEVPDLRLITIDGRQAVASRMVDGLTKSTPTKLAKGGAFDGFATDAWLANWDVAGATMDNLLIQGSRAFRVDTGGALRYRAQGGLKGTAWGDEVTEIQSLRNAGTAPQAAKVYGKMKPADIEASIARVLAVDDDTIDRLVMKFGPEDNIERAALADRLKARRDDLARQYPNAKPVPAVLPDAPDTKRVTAHEQIEVEASRVNGYTIRTDSDTIEDQAVIVSQFTSAAGKPMTRLFLKVRGDGAKAIEKNIPKELGLAGGLNQESLRAQILSLVKSINHRAATGGTMDPATTSKWYALTGKWMAETQKLRVNKAKLLDPASAKAAADGMDKLYQELSNHISPIIAGKAKLTAFRQVDLVKEIPDVIPAAVKAAKATALPWQRKFGLDYELADFNKGNARLNGQTQKLVGVESSSELVGDGYRVRYVGNETGNSVSSRGMLIIEVEDVGAAASARGFTILEKIGVKATRSTQADRLELYLDRIAYIRTIRNETLDSAYKAAGKITDPTGRADAKLKLLNADAGRDMTKSRYWNPDGEHQAFGHGRVLINRPDLDDAQVKAFAKDYVVYHNTSGLGVGYSRQWDNIKKIIEGGGQIGSQVDRVRRGVAAFGSSITSDHRTGGANYIFTRLRSRGAAKNMAGIHWNPERLMRRSDAFSYKGDVFGNVSRATQKSQRVTDPKGWIEAARNGGNETNFRDSISLFDDVEQIVLLDRAEYNQALGDMRAMGYRTWPDGRKLEDVFDYQGSGKK